MLRNKVKRNGSSCLWGVMTCDRKARDCYFVLNLMLLFYCLKLWTPITLANLFKEQKQEIWILLETPRFKVLQLQHKMGGGHFRFQQNTVLISPWRSSLWATGRLWRKKQWTFLQHLLHAGTIVENCQRSWWLILTTPLRNWGSDFQIRCYLTPRWRPWLQVFVYISKRKPQAVCGQIIITTSEDMWSYFTDEKTEYWQSQVA